MKKLLVLLAVLLLTFSMLFVTATASTGEATVAVPDESANLVGATLVLENNITVRYYAALTNVDDPYDTELLVWTTPQDSYTKGTEDESIPFEGVIKSVGGVPHHCFDLDTFPVKMLADDFYTTVCVKTDGGYVYSNVVKYSVLEYAYKQLGKLGTTASTDANLKSVLNEMLDYAAAAQTYSGYRTDRLANADFVYITVSGGQLNDGFTKGLYPKGNTVTVTADEYSGDKPFAYWQNAVGETVSTDRTATLTPTKNDTYTAVYGTNLTTEMPALTMPSFDINFIPKYSQTTQDGYVVLNGNVPFFTQNQIVDESYEYYSPLDRLGRCGIAVSCLGIDLMPTEDRGNISSVTPTGWHGTSNDPIVQANVPGGSLYNRSHLLAFSLTGENANTQNLITGTQSFNQIYMQIFENMVLDIMKEYKASGQDYHIMYRVTPVFEGDNLVATGVIMEAWSVEDNGADVCFCVFVYNEQPGFTIDFATGDYALYTDDGGNSGGSTEPEAPAPDEPDTPDTPDEPQAYYMTYTSGGTTYYFNGTVSSGRGGATTDKSKAVKLYIEATAGGYYIYSVDGGTKHYLSIGNGAQTFGKSTTPTLLTKNSDGAYLVGTRTFSFYATNNDFRTYAYSSNKSLTVTFVEAT